MATVSIRIDAGGSHIVIEESAPAPGWSHQRGDEMEVPKLIATALTRALSGFEPEIREQVPEFESLLKMLDRRVNRSPRMGQCPEMSSGIQCVMAKGHPPIGTDFDHNYGGLGPFTPLLTS